MERSPGRALAPYRQKDFGWTFLGLVLPLVAVALAAFLIYHNLTDGGSTSAAQVTATVDPNHRKILNENITFFEDRVVETQDQLSYNRLVSLYLQRLRESGDIADVKRAELAAQKSLEAAPDNYNGVIATVMVKLAQHDFQGAADLANTALQRKPGSSDALALLGDAQFAMGQYEAAGESYKQVLDKAPGFAAFAREAAMAEVYGNIPVAEQFWHAAIDANAATAPEDSAWARVQYGNLLFTIGRIDEASQQFDASVTIYPGYEAALAGQARVAAARGDDDKAIRLYSEATSRIPLPDYVIALGDVLQRKGDETDMRKQFSLVNAFGQIYVANGVKNDLTLTLFSLDHGGDPATDLGKALTAYQERPSIQAADIYAWALYRNGQFDDAAKYSTEALRYNTQDPLLMFHAGMIALARGDSATAQQELQAALSLNPKFSVQHAPEAEAALKSLKGGAK